MVHNDVLRSVGRQAAGPDVSAEARCKRIEQLQDFALHLVCRGEMTRERREQRQRTGGGFGSGHRVHSIGEFPG